MENITLENFLKTNKKRFLKKDFESLSSILENATQEQLSMISQKTRRPGCWSWVHFLIGEFGIDRFCLGQKSVGILKLIYFVVMDIIGFITWIPYIWFGALLWWLIDEFTIEKRVRKYNMRVVNEIMSTK